MAPTTFQNAAQMKTDERERLHLSRTYNEHLPVVMVASAKLQGVIGLPGPWVAGHSVLPHWQMSPPVQVKNEPFRKQDGSWSSALPRNKLGVFSDVSQPRPESSLEKTMHRRKLEKLPTYVHSSPTRYPQPPVPQANSRPALSSMDTNTALKHQSGNGSFKPNAFADTTALASTMSSSQHPKRKLQRASVEYEAGRMSKLPKIVIDVTTSPDQTQGFNRPGNHSLHGRITSENGNVYPNHLGLSSHFPVFTGLGFEGGPATARSTLPSSASGEQAPPSSSRFDSDESSEYTSSTEESPKSATNAPIPDINILLSTFPAFQTAGPHLPPIKLPSYHDGLPYTPPVLGSPFQPKRFKCPAVSNHEDDEEDNFQLPLSHFNQGNSAPIPDYDDEEEFGKHAYMDRALACRGEDENIQPRPHLKHIKLEPISEYDDDDNSAYMGNVSAGDFEDFPIPHLRTGQHASDEFGDIDRHAYVDNVFVEAREEEEEGYPGAEAYEEEVRVCCTATHCCVCGEDIVTCGGRCSCPCYDTTEKHAHMDEALAGDYEEEDSSVDDLDTCSQEENAPKPLTDAERRAYIDRVFAGEDGDFPIDDLDTEAQEEEAGKEFDEVYDFANNAAIAEGFEAAGREFDDVHNGRALQSYSSTSDTGYHTYDEEAEGRSGESYQPATHNTVEDALSDPNSPAPQEFASGRDANGDWDGIDIHSPAADYVDDESWRRDYE